MALLGQDPDERALLTYLELPDRERAEVREARRLEVLEWLEEAAARVEPRRAVAAVLALRGALSLPVDGVLAALAPHEEALAGMPSASRAMERARAESSARSANRAAEALDQVEARLRAGDLRSARRALLAARALLGPAELGRADALDERLAVRERLERPVGLGDGSRSGGIGRPTGVGRGGRCLASPLG